MAFRTTILAALFAAAIGSGLIGGIFYAFSSFVMAALGRLTPARATEAMNAINVTVITPSFLAVFAGMALSCAALAVGAFFAWQETAAKLVFAASIAYLIGTFGVTMVLNVPLNDELAAFGAARASELWPRFLDVWTTWNTVRTFFALVSSALFIAALLFVPQAEAA